jgi:hypothetical protein
MGEETFFMPGRILASLLTFGALSRTWEGSDRERRRTALLQKYPQLGYFDDAGFDPAKWQPILDNPAFVRQTARDRYWGAKRVVAFSAMELRAAVALGHYPPATEERLFEILWHRRERIARAFFGKLTALDYFQFVEHRLCFDDLFIEAGLGGERNTRYSARVDGTRPLPVDGRCVLTSASPGYHVVELSAERSGELRRRGVKVHFIADSRTARVVGIER